MPRSIVFDAAIAFMLRSSFRPDARGPPSRPSTSLLVFGNALSANALNSLFIGCRRHIWLPLGIVALDIGCYVEENFTMADWQDYYTILQIRRDASEEEVKKSFRTLGANRLRRNAQRRRIVHLTRVALTYIASSFALSLQPKSTTQT